MAIKSHEELKVWQTAMDLSMQVFWGSRRFPAEEKYSLTDQIRRASRSVAGQIAEAWRKRRYPASFVSKLTDAEAEAAETQTWIEVARRCKYWKDADALQLKESYESLLAQLVPMATHPDPWCNITPAPRRRRN
jgi:four helix bundle protein